MRITRTSIPWIVACVVIVVVTALLVHVSRSTTARSVQTTAPPGPALRQPPPSPAEPMSATALDAAYEANAANADRRFKGKDINIVGTIVDIGKDALGAPYVKLGTHPDSRSGVQAVFHPGADHLVASLAKGDSVTLHCTVTGKVVNVVLDDCERH